MDHKITNEHDKDGHYWLINNTYRINKDDGSINYEQEIPQEIYDLRDRLIYNNK